MRLSKPGRVQPYSLAVKSIVPSSCQGGSVAVQGALGMADDRKRKWQDDRIALVDGTIDCIERISIDRINQADEAIQEAKRAAVDSECLDPQCSTQEEHDPCLSFPTSAGFVCLQSSRFSNLREDLHTRLGQGASGVCQRSSLDLFLPSLIAAT